MKILICLCLLMPWALFAKDYKSLQSLKAGDVISADVFNEIYKEIENALKNPTSEDLLGTWDVVESTVGTAEGFYGNAQPVLEQTDRAEGYTANFDDVYKQRTYSLIFSDDGDGTYSFNSNTRCAFPYSKSDGSGGAGNSSCAGKFAVVDGLFVNRFVKDNGDIRFLIHSLNKISDTRFTLQITGSSYTFRSLRLDKNNLVPNPPQNLSGSITDGAVSLSWSAVEAETTVLIAGDTPVTQSEGAVSSYKIQFKDSVEGTYSDLATTTSTSYTDSISSGVTRWYRVFAINDYGSSAGSNVIKLTYSE